MEVALVESTDRQRSQVELGHAGGWLCKGEVGSKDIRVM